MGALTKLVVALGLLSLVRSQQPIYTAYAPGQHPLYSPRLAPTPRLVALKVRPPPMNIRPFYMDLPSFDNVDDPRAAQSRISSGGPYRPHPHSLSGHNSGQGQLGLGTEGLTGGRHIRITTRPPPHYSHSHSQQSGEGVPVKRIRVAAAPQYALEQGAVQFTQTVPAVATYKPQQPLAYAQQPVPQYYVPRSQGVQQQGVQQGVRSAALRPQLQGKAKEEVEDEYPADPNPQYNFAFDVKDDDFTNYQNRQETRDGGVTKGSYSVVDPDGYVRTVTYTASPKGGFQAKVTREPTDVKIKFPVPTQAPEEDPAKSQRQIYAQPQQQYAQQPQQYAQPQYVARRFPHRLQAQYAQ